MKKKGQTTSGVAALILVIGLFIVAYVLFLPVEERRALLGGDNVSRTTTTGGAGAKTLLIESVGKLMPVATSEVKHEISPVNLFLKIEPRIETLANTLSISKSLVSESSPTINFEVEDLSNLEKASLFLNVKEAEGRLKIKLNGNSFYTEKLDKGLKVVNLPIGLLKKNNELSFYVSSPGIAFWATNNYVLKDVSIKEEFELVNSKETRLFSVPSKEKEDLKNSKLSYFMYCNALEGDYAQLKIYLNGKSLFAGFINCAGTSREVEISTDKLKSGTNELMFAIDKGDFLFSDIKVINGLKEGTFPSYHFELTNDEIKSVKDKKGKVYLNFELDNNGKAKRASIGVNNKEVILDTTTGSFSRDISSLVNEGDNIIRIVPSNEFNLKLLSVELK